MSNNIDAYTKKMRKSLNHQRIEHLITIDYDHVTIPVDKIGRLLMFFFTI